MRYTKTLACVALLVTLGGTTRGDTVRFILATSKSGDLTRISLIGEKPVGAVDHVASNVTKFRILGPGGGAVIFLEGDGRLVRLGKHATGVPKLLFTGVQNFEIDGKEAWVFVQQGRKVWRLNPP